MNIQGHAGWSLKLEPKFRSHFWAQLRRFFHTREARSGFHSSSLRVKQISLSVGSSLSLVSVFPKIRTAGSKAAKCELVWNRNFLEPLWRSLELPYLFDQFCCPSSWVSDSPGFGARPEGRRGEKKGAESTRTLENATCFFKWLGGNCSLEKFNALKQVFLKASDSAVWTEINCRTRRVQPWC